MDRVDQVAAALSRAGETARIQRTEFPEIEDDSIELGGGGLHVQVGETYLILVRHNADGTFTFFSEAQSFVHLVRQIREARAANLPFAADGLPTRDQRIAEGATVHRSTVDDADYVVIGPRAERKGYAVLKFDASGKPSVVAESTTEEGATRSLEGYLDGTHRAAADRFFRWMDDTEAAVRPEVADPLHAAGYHVYHTGGHCLAWMRGLSDNDPHSYVLISIEDRIDGDPAATEWMVGRYDGEGWINIHETFTLAEAMRVAELLPPAVGPDGEPVEEVYADLAAALAALTGAPSEPVADTRHHATCGICGKRYEIPSDAMDSMRADWKASSLESPDLFPPDATDAEIVEYMRPNLCGPCALQHSPPLGS